MIGADDAILGFIPCNFGDNMLHLVLGALGLAAAVGDPAADGGHRAASGGPAASTSQRKLAINR